MQSEKVKRRSGRTAARVKCARGAYRSILMPDLESRVQASAVTLLQFWYVAQPATERLRSTQAAAPEHSQCRSRLCEHAGHIEVEGHEPQRKQKHGGDKDHHSERTLSSVDITMIGYRRT
jgi:hypothetical protein